MSLDTVSVPIRRMADLVRLVRPLNALLFMVGTMLGGFLSAGGAGLSSPRLWWAVGAATLVGAAANVINDVFDVDIDRINRPMRPLASGAVPVGVARGLWAAMSILGVSMAALVSTIHGLVAVGSVVLLFGYSARLKRVAVAGNLVVAFVVAMALPFGALAVGSFEAVLPAALFAFLITLSREIVKDIEDITGDRAGGARTLPIVAGTPIAARLARLTIAVTAVAAPLPVIILGYADLYLLLLVPTCGTLLAAATFVSPSAPRLRDASRMLKIAMVLGIASFTAATF